jgi:hypothetical protein
MPLADVPCHAVADFGLIVEGYGNEVGNRRDSLDESAAVRGHENLVGV